MISLHKTFVNVRCQAPQASIIKQVYQAFPVLRVSIWLLLNEVLHHQFPECFLVLSPKLIPEVIHHIVLRGNEVCYLCPLVRGLGYDVDADGLPVANVVELSQQVCLYPITCTWMQC